MSVSVSVEREVRKFVSASIEDGADAAAGAPREDDGMEDGVGPLRTRFFKAGHTCMEGMEHDAYAHVIYDNSVPPYDISCTSLLP